MGLLFRKKSDDERLSLTDSLELVLNFNGDVLRFKTGNGDEMGSVKVSDLRQNLITELGADAQTVEPDKMVVLLENDRIKAKVCFKYIYGRNNNGILLTESINSVILVRLK